MPRPGADSNVRYSLGRKVDTGKKVPTISIQMQEYIVLELMPVTACVTVKYLIV